MLLLILAVGLFIFAWSRHRASVQRMRNIERQMDQVYGVNYPRTVPRPMGIPNPPAQTSTHTYAEDVAVAAGVGLAGAAVYELLSHERDEDSSSSNNDDDDDDDDDDDNDDSSDDDSDDGFSGGDSGGGGSDGDF